MFDKNSVTLLGNLTADPETRDGSKGQYTTFKVATNERWKDGDEWKDKAEFHSVIAFHERLVTRLGTLKKGARVLVEAKLKSRKDGETYKIDIVAEDLEVITRPEKAAA
jgi:single-strand DNA-binding protein